MKLSDICVSVKQAKQLKEAGYPQKSLFYWVNSVLGYELCTLDSTGGFHSMETSNFGMSQELVENYAAPTLDEILEAIPKIDGYGLTVLKLDILTVVGYKNSHDFWEFPGNLTGEAHCNDQSPPNAAAKFYLYVKKYGLNEK